jgi:hypothetical protein
MSDIPSFTHLRSVLAMTALCSAVAGCGGRVEQSDGERARVEGELVTYAGIAVDGSKIVKHALRLEDGREIALDFAEAPNFKHHARLRVDGTVAGANRMRVEQYDIVVPEGNVGVVEEALITHGPRDVAVIMVHWSQPGFVTAQQMRDALDSTPTSAGAMIAQSSFGKVSISGNVFGWYQIEDPVNCDDIYLIAQRAQAAAAAAGVNLAPFEHKAFIINPGTSLCTFSGLGELGTPASPMQLTWYNSSSSPYLFAHELGHNLGFFHAHSYNCGSSIGPRGTCTTDEYGDPFDPMGIANTHFGPYHKAAQAWYEPCDVVTTPRSGVFTIAPAEVAANAIQVLRVPMSSSLCPVDVAEPCYYYLENRKPIGIFDGNPPYSTSPSMDGVLVRANLGIDTTGNSFLTGPWLLDMTPGSTAPDGFGTFWDASLGNGKTFGDPAGVRMRVLSQTGNDVKVAVKVPNGTGPVSCLDGTQLSTPSSCGNGVKDAGESDVDCGGPNCIPCDDGKICVAHPDCWSGTCLNGVCATSCTDGTKNGDETDVDCGGSCGDCATGRACLANGDCLSNVCSAGKFCTSNQLVGTLTVHSDWQTGFCGALNLQNTASTPTTSWSAQVNFTDSTFTSLSGAVANPSAGGGTVTLTPAPWNSTIWPSSHASISFCASKTGSGYFPEFHFVTASY